MRTKNKENDIKKSYEVMIKATLAAFKALGHEAPAPEKLQEAFAKYLVEKGIINPVYADILSKIIDARRMMDENKLAEISEKEISTNREYVRRFVSEIRIILEKPGIAKTISKEEESVEKKMEKAKEIVESAKESEDLESKPAEEKKVEKIERKIKKELKKHKR
jgi:uncharacterized protein (UPF0332 family)